MRFFTPFSMKSGHALGLDHSPYLNDIMYVPHQYGIVSISERDKLTLKWLYTFPYGCTGEEILAKFKFSSQYNLDHLVYRLENQDEQTEEVVKERINEQKRSLDEDQEILAEFNKFNLALQNVNISPEFQEYMKKTRLKKNFEDSV